jgi:hypothetical protein
MAAIDRLFERLALTYGASWQYSLGAAPIMDIKSMWAHELAPFLQSRESMNRVVWALENLPERPPNAIQFKNLCRQAPAPETPMLPSPPANPERVAAELAKLAPILAQQSQSGDPKAWAKRIMLDHKGGFKRPVAVVQMARQALNNV